MFSVDEQQQKIVNFLLFQMRIACEYCILVLFYYFSHPISTENNGVQIHECHEYCLSFFGQYRDFFKFRKF